MTSPQSIPAADISIAESEMARQEAALEAEVNRIKTARRQAADHLDRAKRVAEEPTLKAELSGVEVPSSASVQTQADEARFARLRALAVRKASAEIARQTLKAHEEELARVYQLVREAEGAAKQRALQRAAPPPPVEDAESIDETLVRAMAAPPQHEEHRSTPRVSLCAEISLGSEDNFFTGFTNDVSEGGVFVATINLMPLGTQVNLSFTLPGGQHVEGKGEVRWVRVHDERNPDVFPGMGIRFVGLAQSSVAAIHAFTEQREPMFFPET